MKSLGRKRLAERKQRQHERIVAAPIVERRDRDVDEFKQQLREAVADDQQKGLDCSRRFTLQIHI